MNLEDLLRDTRTVRAGDVDGVELQLAPVAIARRPSHRRSTVAAVVTAVLAAAVVAVLVVAAGIGTDSATPAPATSQIPTPLTPPPGEQYISFHGLTLTVPVAWPVVPFSCAEPPADAVVVPVAVSAACGHVPSPNSTPGSTVLYLTSASEPADGLPTTVAGLPATRAVGADPFVPTESRVGITFANPAFGFAVRAPTVAEADAIIATARSAPVDTRGCTDRLDTDLLTGSAPADPILPSQPTAVVACEYLQTFDGRTPIWLSASRELDAAQIADLSDRIAASTPYAPDGSGSDVAGVDPIRYLMRFADGSARTVDVRYRHDVVVSDDGHTQVALTTPGEDPIWQFPTAFTP